MQNWFDERLTRQSDYLAELFVEAEAECRAQIWLVRVPSKSNAADHPSRGLTAKLKENNRVDHSDLAAVVLESWKLLHTNLKWGDEREQQPFWKKEDCIALCLARFDEKADVRMTMLYEDT